MEKKSFIFVSEFNEWVGTLMDATQEEFITYSLEIQERMLADGSPKGTEVIVYEINKNHSSFKLV